MALDGFCGYIFVAFCIGADFNRGIECVVVLNSDCDYAKDNV